jgi:hypothetical protein
VPGKEERAGAHRNARVDGGASLLAGVVESAGARGPAREESGVAEPRRTVRFCIYLN